MEVTDMFDTAYGRSVDLDDAALELTKIAVIRGGGGAALENGVELRFVEIETGDMVFCWINAMGESVMDKFALPRAFCDEIAADLSAWRELGQHIAEKPFVDMERTLYGVSQSAS